MLTKGEMTQRLPLARPQHRGRPTSTTPVSTRKGSMRLSTLMPSQVRLAHPDEHGPQDLYEVATRMADDAGDAASVIDAPDEFSDSGAAFEKYAEQLEQTYRQIAESLNNPSLENSHNVLQAVALDNEYTEEAMSAFKRDLANSHFTKKEETAHSKPAYLKETYGHRANREVPWQGAAADPAFPAWRLSFT